MKASLCSTHIPLIWNWSASAQSAIFLHRASRIGSSERQAALPCTSVVAAPGLGARKQVRESGLRIDQDVDGAPEEWAESTRSLSRGLMERAR
jgi:hypothetical protein